MSRHVLVSFKYLEQFRCGTLDYVIEHHSRINLATFNLAQKSHGVTLLIVHYTVGPK